RPAEGGPEDMEALRDSYRHLYGLRYFFQAEDGIRAGHVTGVQTCALPIYPVHGRRSQTESADLPGHRTPSLVWQQRMGTQPRGRSEERRVGKECRSRRSGDYQDKKEDCRAYCGHEEKVGEFRCIIGCRGER